MTIEEKALSLAQEYALQKNKNRAKAVYQSCIEMSQWVEENPSDETIMLILNCIGYEEKSWVEFVRKELEKRK